VSVLEGLFRVLAELGSGATWFLGCITAVVAVFVLYIGVVLVATLRAGDEERRKVCYDMFRDLLGLFRRGGAA
jgi:hypothetical protein